MGQNLGGSAVAQDAILAAAVPAVSEAFNHKPSEKRTFQAFGITSAGAGASTIIVEATNEETPTVWVLLGTITLVLSTTVVSDGFATDAPWRHVRFRITAISGTDAAVTTLIGI